MVFSSQLTIAVDSIGTSVRPPATSTSPQCVTQFRQFGSYGPDLPMDCPWARYVSPAFGNGTLKDLVFADSSPLNGRMVVGLPGTMPSRSVCLDLPPWRTSTEA